MQWYLKKDIMIACKGVQALDIIKKPIFFSNKQEFSPVDYCVLAQPSLHDLARIAMMPEVQQAVERLKLEKENGESQPKKETEKQENHVSGANNKH